MNSQTDLTLALAAGETDPPSLHQRGFMSTVSFNYDLQRCTRARDSERHRESQNQITRRGAPRAVLAQVGLDQISQAKQGQGLPGCPHFGHQPQAWLTDYGCLRGLGFYHEMF